MKDILKPSYSLLIGNEGLKDFTSNNNIIKKGESTRAKNTVQAYLTKKPSLLHNRYIAAMKDILKPSHSFIILHLGAGLDMTFKRYFTGNNNIIANGG